MKKLFAFALICILALMCSFSAMAEQKSALTNNPEMDAEVEAELARYFSARKSLLTTGETKDLADTLIDGIVNDEVKHYASTRSACYSDTFSIVHYESVDEEIDVEVKESTLEGDVLHKIVLYKRAGGGWIVVSDGYYNSFDGFRSASWISPEEVAELEEMLEAERNLRDNPVGGVAVRQSFLTVANGEVGYLEKASNYNLDNPTANPGNNDYTKYGAQFNNNPAKWCAMFVSWCGNHASVSTNIIPYLDTVLGHINKFTEWGRYYTTSSSYTPKKGDIFFMMSSDTQRHMGIVTAVSSTAISVIDGNATPVGGTYQAVRTYSFARTDTRLLGYGNPNYCYGNNHSPSNSYSSNLYTHWHTCTLCGAKVAEANHTWVNMGTYYKCNVCGKTSTTGPGVSKSGGLEIK